MLCIKLEDIQAKKKMKKKKKKTEHAIHKLMDLI